MTNADVQKVRSHLATLEGMLEKRFGESADEEALLEFRRVCWAALLLVHDADFQEQIDLLVQHAKELFRGGHAGNAGQVLHAGAAAALALVAQQHRPQPRPTGRHQEPGTRRPVALVAAAEQEICTELARVHRQPAQRLARVDQQQRPTLVGQLRRLAHRLDGADLVLRVRAGAYLIEGANPRHEHEWRVWEKVKLPKNSVLVPGVISHATNVVEHPELVAERIVRIARLVGRENVLAGTDCGFAQGPFHRRVHPSIMWAKLETLAAGARLASKELWN